MTLLATLLYLHIHISSRSGEVSNCTHVHSQMQATNPYNSIDQCLGEGRCLELECWKRRTMSKNALIMLAAAVEFRGARMRRGAHRSDFLSTLIDQIER